MESAHFKNLLRWQMQSITQWWQLWRRDAHSSDQGHSPGDIQSRRWDWSDPVTADAGSQWPQFGIKRGEDTMLSMAAGEVVPLTSDGDEWYLKVLINNENVFIRIDVWAACRECPPSWVRCFEPGERGEENHSRVSNDHQNTQRFWGEEQFEPRTNWSCGQTPQYADAGRRWWADACETLVWPRGISHLAVRRHGRCRCAECFLMRRISPCYCLEMRR